MAYLQMEWLERLENWGYLQEEIEYNSYFEDSYTEIKNLLSKSDCNGHDRIVSSLIWWRSHLFTH